MFSNKARLLKIIFLAVVLLILCTYAGWVGPRVDHAPGEILTDPAQVGQHIEIQYAEVIGRGSESQDLILRASGHEFAGVFADLIQVQEGQDISLSGTISAVDQLAVDRYHIHPYRMVKYYFSLPAIALVLFLLFKHYQFDRKRLLFFEKSNRKEQPSA
jgi:hypothetical protein